MPFKVKATLIGFLGNTERYPCHFNHKVGDEVIFDGEKYHWKAMLGCLANADSQGGCDFRSRAKICRTHLLLPFLVCPFEYCRSGHEKV